MKCILRFTTVTDIKRIFSMVLSLILVLNLVACGTAGQSAQAPVVDTEAAPNSAQNSSVSDFPVDSSAPVVSEEDVRALYAKDYEESPDLPPVQSITKYEGDFLVLLGYENDMQWLDWVYGQSGIRRRMMELPQQLLDMEIIGPATIKVLTGGGNVYNGVPSFPHVETVSLNFLYNEQGHPLEYDFYRGGLSNSGTYWANAGEKWSMGMMERREAVRSAQIDAGGVTVAFAPLADGSDFIAAYCEIPFTEVSFPENGNTILVTFYDTFLDSGTLTETSDTKDFLDFLQEYGSLYPEDFPAGELIGNCVLIQKAEISQEGNNVVLTLTLNEEHLGDNDYFQYTVDSDYTGIADNGPYFRIQLRATNELFDD